MFLNLAYQLNFNYKIKNMLNLLVKPFKNFIIQFSVTLNFKNFKDYNNHFW